MKIKFLAALAMGGLLTGVSARAQDATTNAPATITQSTNATPRVVHAPNVGRLAMMLNLTADQQTQVGPILSGQQKKVMAVMHDSTLSTDDKRSQIKAIRADTATQMQSILTADQYTKWESLQHMHHRPQSSASATNAAPQSAQ